MNVLDVWAEVDTVLEAGTTNVVGIKLCRRPDGTAYSPGFAVGTNRKREIVVDDPAPGTWYVEARGTRGLSTVPVTSPTQVAPQGPVDGNVVQIKYVPPYVADIQGHPLQSDINVH